MARSGITVLSLTILLALLEIGSCLRCYQCNSQSDPGCADPFSSNRYLVDCSTQDSLNYNTVYLRNILPDELLTSVVGAPRYCHKIVLQTGTVVRTCLDSNPGDLNRSCHLLDNVAKRNPADIKKQIKHCSVCEKEGCNAAGSITASLPLAALAVVASYLYYKQ